MKNKLPAACCCINVFGETFEADALRVEFANRLDEMLEGSAKPIQPPDRDRIPCTDVGNRLLEPFTLRLRPACGVSEDFGAAGFLERVQLEIQGLICG